MGWVVSPGSVKLSGLFYLYFLTIRWHGDRDIAVASLSIEGGRGGRGLLRRDKNSRTPFRGAPSYIQIYHIFLTAHTQFVLGSHTLFL